MKFGKRLKIHLEETLPEWRDKFVAYKQLKKRLKLLRSAPDCFAEVAFIPATESADSDVGRVDSMLRNGTEIGHYGNRLQLGRFPEAALEERVEPARGGAPAAAAVASSSAPGAAADAATRGAEPRPEGPRQQGQQGQQQQQQGGSPPGSRKRKPTSTSDDSDGEVDGPYDHGPISGDQAEFINLLNVELDKFNSFFTDKEEEYVIRLQVGVGSSLLLAVLPSLTFTCMSSSHCLPLAE